MASGQSPAEDIPQVYDAQPLLEAARRVKDDGNNLVKKKMYSEAIMCYESGIKTLDKADGHPMLRNEVMEMVALKATLYGNIAQCQLNLEFYRRAVEAANESLALDDTNTKNIYRRFQAHEALKNYAEAETDILALQKLGGGSLTPDAVMQKLALVREKKKVQEEEKIEAQLDEEADDLGRMKERFDEIVEKYDLKNDDSAADVADWLTSGEWQVTVKRVADRWHMDLIDAHDFLAWIAKGCEFQKQNAENAAAAQAAHPHQDL